MNPSYANTILSISLRKASTGISTGEKDRTSAVLLQGSPRGEALPATTCPLNQKVKNRSSLIRATSSRSTRTFSPVSSQNSRTAASSSFSPASCAPPGIHQKVSRPGWFAQGFLLTRTTSPLTSASVNTPASQGPFPVTSSTLKFVSAGAPYCS